MLNTGEELRIIGREKRQIIAVARNASPSGNHAFVLWEGASRRLWSYSDRRQVLLCYTLQPEGIMPELLGDDLLVLKPDEQGMTLTCIGGPDGSYGLAELRKGFDGSSPIKGFRLNGMGWKRLCTEIRHETRAKVPVAALRATKAIAFSEAWFYPDHIELTSEDAHLWAGFRSVRYRGSRRSRAQHIFSSNT